MFNVGYTWAHMYVIVPTSDFHSSLMEEALITQSLLDIILQSARLRLLLLQSGREVNSVTRTLKGFLASSDLSVMLFE